MMRGFLRRIMPEKMSSSEAVHYAQGPARTYMPQYRLMAAEIAAAATGILVDIGTGPGNVPLEVGKRAPEARIIGIDVSEKMIEIAQKNKEAYSLANVSFKVMDARELAFGDNTLDMIISTDALHHWKNPVTIIGEMHRCLKPGAEAWIYDGFSGATNQDIKMYTSGIRDIFPFPSLVRLILGLHGFSQKEYDTTVRKLVAQTPFKTCVSEKRGIMMRLRLRKL
jgi:ubiquinone/menaquinone biosynthesis C-methylase UbiE